MHTPISPLFVFIRIAGRRLLAAEYSEGGLTLPADILAAPPFQEARRGAVAAATLELCADGGTDAYPVALRLAAVTPAGVEVTFADLPAQARLRLRHNARLAESDLAAAPAGEAVAELEQITLSPGTAAAREASSGRRLILPGSAALLQATAERRASLRLAQRPAPAPSPAVDVGQAARVVVLRAIAALAVGTVVILLLATMLVLS
jgi:hypothetical protein